MTGLLRRTRTQPAAQQDDTRAERWLLPLLLPCAAAASIIARAVRGGWGR